MTNVQMEKILGTLNLVKFHSVAGFPRDQSGVASCTVTETSIKEQTTMSLLDKVLDSRIQVQEALNPAEAFAAITLAATASDGYLSEEETRVIYSALSRMKLFRSYPYDVMNRMLDRLLTILRRQGIDVLFKTAKESLPYNLRESAFAVATDLVLSDGIVTQEEKEFLNDLYQALDIPGELATQIVQVMLIKHRG
jgi:tellurite resistance protein